MSIKHLTDPEFIAGKKTQWNKSLHTNNINHSFT